MKKITLFSGVALIFFFFIPDVKAQNVKSDNGGSINALTSNSSTSSPIKTDGSIANPRANISAIYVPTSNPFVKSQLKTKRDLTSKNSQAIVHVNASTVSMSALESRIEYINLKINDLEGLLKITLEQREEYAQDHIAKLNNALLINRKELEELKNLLE